MSAPSKGSPAFNLSRLARPRRAVDLSRCLIPSVDFGNGKSLKGFETRRQARAENARRARSLQKLARSLKDRKSKLQKSRRAARLGKLLRRAVRASDRKSFANALFMREARRRFLGELLRVTSAATDEARIYNVVTPKWKLRASQLSSLRPKRLIESLRALLTKAGLNNLSGWAIVFFHNEYQRTTDTYQPHFHAIVVAEKFRAFEALRKLKMFQGGKGSDVYRPILVQELSDPARQLSYLWKGYWLQTKSTTIHHSRGSRKHRPKHRRIREPHHAESILFMDGQRFVDLVWMHGISIKEGRLVPKRRQ